jgi:hypothetical protein
MRILAIDLGKVKSVACDYASETRGAMNHEGLKSAALCVKPMGTQRHAA